MSYPAQMWLTIDAETHEQAGAIMDQVGRLIDALDGASVFAAELDDEPEE